MKNYKKLETKFLSKNFERSIRLYGIKTLANKIGVNVNLITHWLDGINKARVDNPRIKIMAKVVGFDGEMFE